MNNLKTTQIKTGVRKEYIVRNPGFLSKINKYLIFNETAKTFKQLGNVKSV